MAKRTSNPLSGFGMTALSFMYAGAAGLLLGAAYNYVTGELSYARNNLISGVVVLIVTMTASFIRRPSRKAKHSQPPVGIDR